MTHWIFKLRNPYNFQCLSEGIYILFFDSPNNHGKKWKISLIFDKCSMLLQTQSRLNRTSYRNFHFNEFVANAMGDNIGSKKTACNPRKKIRPFFSFKYQKFTVRVNHTIKHNQTQWHKVNDFDFCLVSKCLHISNCGLDF